MRPVRITVTGAAGQIGYALLTRIVAGDMLGDRPIELRLLELPGALKALEGVAMEIDDCAPSRLVGLDMGSDPRAMFDGCDVALLVGSKPRSKGMQRSDLLEANGSIFAEQGKVLAEVASSELRVVVTGNPANTNALVAAGNAGGIPCERFSALTRLDHDRAKAMLARRARCSVAEVTQVTVWGNHSSTQYPDLSHARINGRPVARWVDDCWTQFDFVPAVANRGAAIIAARGRSSAASAANATIAHVRDWFLGTAQGDWTSMAVVSPGLYGVPEGLVSSFPVTCRDGEWHIVRGMRLDAMTRMRIQTSVTELEQEREAVRAAGLLR